MYGMSYLVAAVTAIVLIRVLRRVAVHIGLVDQPGWRKGHDGAIPVIGGLAIFLAFVFGLLMIEEPLGGMRAYIAGAALIVLIGVLDDMRELPSSARFGVQIAAALMMVYWGELRLDNLGFLVSNDQVLHLGAWAAPLTVFAVVGVINAVNMIDGIDGLAGSISLVVILSLLVLAGPAAGLAFQVLLLLALVVAVFLFYNLRFPWQPRALIFMGDAGSMFLGFSIAWYLVDFSQGDGAVLLPVTAIWILGLPLIDTVSLMLRRLLRRRSPFEADREHMHHLLISLGVSPGPALIILVLLAGGLAFTGLAAQYSGIAEPTMFWAFLAVFVIYFLITRQAWQSGWFFGRKLERRSGRERRLGESGSDYRGQERRRAEIDCRRD